MINNIDTILKALTIFPDRPNYTSSNAYGAAVAKWLKENKELSEALTILIPELNTIIGQINTDSENIASIENNISEVEANINQMKQETSDFKNLAEKYSEENEDVEVEENKYSSKHWALKAQNAVSTLPLGTLLDSIVSESKAWSSSKIVEELENKNHINRPTITSPIDNAIDTEIAITIIGSSYATSNNFLGEHTSSKVVFATDSDFTNILSTITVGLEELTANSLPPSTKIYAKLQYISGNFSSSFSEPISFTTMNAGIQAPTILSPLNNTVDLGKNIAIETDIYSTFGHTEIQKSASYKIYKDVGLTILQEENLNDTQNLTSWTSGNLDVTTDYYIIARKESENYSSGWSNSTKITTKSQFTPTIGTQGEWGFGVAPTDEPFAVLGLAEMTGTNTVGHANYGNYIHTNGSIVCWNPKGFYRIGHASSPRFATYGANAIDIVGTETFADETEANASGYVLPRVFINNGTEQAGYFQDKYMNSKDGTTAGKSVFGGNPIGMTSNASYNPSSTMTGCTGILADAVTLSRARGTRWNCSSAFMYAWAAMVSVAHGQATTSTANCAWYDATLTTNFPKGCNNGALSDTNDATVGYTASPDNAAKPLTGATSNFNKTTHNGCANGIADLNGGSYEVPIGVTNYGTIATDTTAITNDTIYVLKTTVDHASLTGGWNGATDAWGAAATLASRFDAVTSPHPLGSSTGVVYWGNSTNAAFSTDASGANRNLCGFIPKDSSASNATGINMLGNDYFYKYGRANQVPLCCGYWGSAANAGLFCRYFFRPRSYDYYYASFRVSAYFG